MSTFKNSRKVEVPGHVLGIEITLLYFSITEFSC